VYAVGAIDLTRHGSGGPGCPQGVPAVHGRTGRGPRRASGDQAGAMNGGLVRTVLAGVVGVVTAVGQVPVDPGGPGAGPGSSAAGPSGAGPSGAGPSGVAAVPAPGARYSWPLLPRPPVGDVFRAPSFRYGTGHRGADLVGTAGQAVLAARAGTVVFAARLAGRGVVSIEHADGLRTTYEPVRATVAAGVRVGRGDVIGVLEAGHAGCPTEACLHWGVRRGEADYLDPLVLLRPARVRLLPEPPPV
jgi:murein DD-endopeptidase MepM/ murein hydrolase activator NlpD